MKRAVAISDVHSGSVYGMLPPKFITSEGIPKLQNAGQKYLWRCWVDFCSRVKEFKPSHVFINGDIVDGRQQKQRGSEWSLPLMADQIQSCLATLKYLRESTDDKCKWYFMSGTPYHAGDCGEYEEAVSSRLGGIPYQSIGLGRYCREVLNIEIDGIMFNVAHGIGVGSGFYRSTAADREGQWSAMAAKDPSKGVPKADVVLRAHAHNFIHVEHASKHIIVGPAWELQTGHMRKNSQYRMIPDIGGLMFEIDYTAKKRYEDPVKLIKHRYDLPPMPVNKG